MPFDLPALSDTRDLVVALGRALFPGLNFGSLLSYHGKWATFLAGAVTQLHFHVDSAQRDLHPLTAGDGKPINDWGAALRVDRKDASPARKSLAGRVRGEAGATVNPLEQLRHPQTGLLFQIANATIITIPGVVGVDPDSFVDADIAGVDVGSQTRLEAGQTLNFLTQPPGIQSEVVLQLDLDEDGFDEEQFGSYRGRVLSTMSSTPSGGNQGDFVTWAKAALVSVSTAFAYPNRNGRGTIDVVAFYAASGTSRSLSTQDRDTVAAYIRTKAPFQVSGTGGGLRVLLTVADPQTIEILVTTTGVLAFAFDWQGSGETVLAYNATTRELQFAAVLPASLRAGHRIILKGTVGGSGVNAQDGREYRIEAISAADKVILEKAPPTNPAATDLIFPGGPLVAPIRDAIVGHLNGETVYAGRGQVPIPQSKAAPTISTGPSIVGLDELAAGIGSSNPGGIYNDTLSWSGGIVRAVLFKIATYKAGVQNITIVSPAADYEPLDDPFPTSSQIHYVTPSVVVVREA
jgi:uncharacterized phage protein gp47/JayE